MNNDRTSQLCDKIRSLADLADTLAELKRQGKCIVHSHGVYDLLHPTHVRHLATAKGQGDVLVVTVTSDPFVEQEPGELTCTAQLRAEALAALHHVDYVAVNEAPSVSEAIRLLKPDVYIKSIDKTHSERIISDETHEEEAAVLEVGGRIHLLNDVALSSRLANIYSPEAEAYLRNFRKRYNAGGVLQALEDLNSLKVMVVGEAILDEYIYGDVLGKSGKEPILALRYLSREIHAGGSLVIANHLADFCEGIDLVTYLGEKDSYEDFIRCSLKKNIRPIFIYKSDSPTIIKRRFVEKYSVTKLLEVYEMNDTPLAGEGENMLCAVLESHLPECDLVIAADYGHGLITPGAIDLLCRRARFLAVNTQINAANNGFHVLSRYPRADYICVHEGEIRLDQRSRSGDLRELVVNLARHMESGTVMVTQGKRGTLLYRPQGGFSECPALSVKVVDRVGAGDAVLAVSSLCAARQLPADIVGFIANLIGAQAVKIVGNRSAVSKMQLCADIEAILK